MDMYFKPVQAFKCQNGRTPFLNMYVGMNELITPMFMSCRSYETLYRTVGLDAYEYIVSVMERRNRTDIINQLILDSDYYKDYEKVIHDIACTFIEDCRDQPEYQAFQKSSERVGMIYKNIFDDGIVTVSLGENISMALALYLKSLGHIRFGLDSPSLICLSVIDRPRLISQFIGKHELDEFRFFNIYDTYFYKNMEKIIESKDPFSIFMVLFFLSERKKELHRREQTQTKKVR